MYNNKPACFQSSTSLNKGTGQSTLKEGTLARVWPVVIGWFGQMSETIFSVIFPLITPIPQYRQHSEGED